MEEKYKRKTENDLVILDDEGGLQQIERESQTDNVKNGNIGQKQTRHSENNKEKRN